MTTIRHGCSGVEINCLSVVAKLRCSQKAIQNVRAIFQKIKISTLSTKELSRRKCIKNVCVRACVSVSCVAPTRSLPGAVCSASILLYVYLCKLHHFTLRVETRHLPNTAATAVAAAFLQQTSPPQPALLITIRYKLFSTSEVTNECRAMYKHMELK